MTLYQNLHLYLLLIAFISACTVIKSFNAYFYFYFYFFAFRPLSTSSQSCPFTYSSRTKKSCRCCLNGWRITRSLPFKTDLRE